MYHLNPDFYPNIKMVLINRIPSLTEDEINIILDVFMCM